MENRRKIEPKQIPSRLIPRLVVVFTRQLEILVTTLSKGSIARWLSLRTLLDIIYCDSGIRRDFGSSDLNYVLYRLRFLVFQWHIPTKKFLIVLPLPVPTKLSQICFMLTGWKRFCPVFFFSQVMMKDISTPVPPDEFRKEIRNCLHQAALVNYTRVSAYAKIEGGS